MEGGLVGNKASLLEFLGVDTAALFMFHISRAKDVAVVWKMEQPGGVTSRSEHPVYRQKRVWPIPRCLFFRFGLLVFA